MEDRESRFGKSADTTYKITKRVTSFALDYNDLDNIPTINGTEVKGDLTSEDIKVVSTNPEDYKSETLEESEGYFTILNEDGNPTKIPVEEVKTEISEEIKASGEELKTEIKNEYENADEKLKVALEGEIGDVDIKADEALEEAKKAGTKFIGTKVEDGELVIVTADYLDAEFSINKWGHLEVKLGDSNASQVMGRIVGGMFYSGLADTAEDIYAEIVSKSKDVLENDIYLCTDNGYLWQYQGGEFIHIMTINGTQIDELEFGTSLEAEQEDDKITLNLLNKQGNKLSSVTLTMPYMKKEDAEIAIAELNERVDALDEKFTDKEKESTYQQVNVTKDGIVIDGANVVEYWKDGQTESDTLADGGLAITKITASQSLAEDSFDTISAVVKEGRARKCYRLGDTKTFRTKSGEEIEVRIVGFDHDGENSITFETVELSASMYVMNQEATNEGGYTHTDMNSSILDEILADFPDDLQGVVREVNKGVADGEEVTKTATKLYIPAVSEIYSAKAIESCTLAGFQDYKETYVGEDEQLEYYKNLIGDQSPSASCEELKRGTTYWLRTPHLGTTDSFWTMYRNGQLMSWLANNGLNISICFAL